MVGQLLFDSRLGSVGLWVGLGVIWWVGLGWVDKNRPTDNSGIAEDQRKTQHLNCNLACVVCQRGGRTDAAPLLRSLHWLPVKHRITYKTAVLTHKVLTTSTPPYLHDMLTVATPARPMRSESCPSPASVPSSLGARSLLQHQQYVYYCCLPTLDCAIH